MKQEPCGCCEGTEILTPMPIANRPGLSALAYRIGTRATFLETMKARLTGHYLEIDSGQVDPQGRLQTTRIRPLQGLTTRDGADPAIALLDAWATVADVLTFYQERIANEGYLPTATERRSILELARLVGYELHPGVASSVYLAFTLEKGQEVEIPAGTRAQSLPGPGELPQPFETSSPFLARAEWNELKPRITAPQSITDVENVDTLYLEGTDLLLARGDPILIDAGGSGTALYRIVDVEPDPVMGHTKVALREWPVPGAAIGGLQQLPESLRKENLRKLFEDLVHGEMSEGQASEIVAGFGDALLQTFKLLAAMPPSPERAQAFQLTVQTLQEARQAIVRINTFPSQSYVHQALKRLQTWIDTVLEIVQAHMPGILTHAVAPGPAVSTILATITHSELVDLLMPPVPPAAMAPLSPYHLVTKPAITFAKGSDFVYHALTSVYQGLKAKMLYTAVQNMGPSESGKVRVYALRTRAAPFGHNAPPRPGRYDPSGLFNAGGEWLVDDPMDSRDAAQDDPLHHESSTLYLDREYEIEADSWIVIETPDALLPVKLDEEEGRSATATSLTAYGLGGKSTRLELGDQTVWLEEPIAERFGIVRGTNVYVESEELSLARVPIAEKVERDTIELASIYDGLKPGRWLIVSGERTDAEGIPGIYDSELVMLANVEQHLPDASIPGDTSYSKLFLGNELAHTYKLDTVTIYGNVVKATHGETRQEVLGSGDGSQAWQRFTLKQLPLTHVSAATPNGIESTLQVRVNHVLWHEADNLARLKANDRKFLTQTDNDDKTTVIFGDGQHGARLPTGGENIRAEYRNGIGRAGNVAAERISLLASRPLGVKAVINPQAATGGADRETGDQARGNIPASVTALDRLVSVQDYADFCRTFAGIGKASATLLRDGRRQFLSLTIAGADNTPIAKTSDLFLNLGRALRKFGDPDLPIRLQLVELMLLIIRARVRLHPDYLWAAVAPEIEKALLEAFGFEQRDLGQDVRLGEVIRAIQGIEGVVYVDVDLLESLSRSEFEDDEAFHKKLSTLTGESGDGVPPRPKPRIPVHHARIDSAYQLLPAQLAILSPDVPATLALEVIES